MAGVFSFYGWIIEAQTIKLTWEGADSLFPPRDGGTGPMLASTCNLKRFGSRWWWKDWMRAFKKNKKNWRLEITSEEQSRPKIWSHTVKTNVPLTNCFKSSNCPAWHEKVTGKPTSVNVESSAILTEIWKVQRQRNNQRLKYKQKKRRPFQCVA